MAHRLEELVAQLPPDLVKQVQDFAEFLLQQRAAESKGKPRFEWAGALVNLRDLYSSVSLQHEASAWRVKESLDGLREDETTS